MLPVSCESCGTPCRSGICLTCQRELAGEAPTPTEETPMDKTKINVPGRVHDFYTGGGAYQAWSQGNTADRDWPEADELELFQAVSAALQAGKRRTAKGGWWVSVELGPEGLAGLRYWAETLETASADNAAEGEQDAKNDLRAAQRVLKKLRGW